MKIADRQVIKWLLRSAGRYKFHTVCLLLLQILLNVGAVCYALVMRWIVDSAVGQKQSSFFKGLLSFGILMLMLMIFRVMLRQIEETVKSGIENRLKEQLLNALLHKDYGQVSMIHSEEWMNRMTSDAVICANGMVEILPGFLGLLIRMFGAVLLLFFLQPQLTGILLPGGLFFLLFTFFLRKYLKEQHKNVQKKDGAVRVYVQEQISSMLVLRTFGVENQAVSGAKRKLDEYRSARIRKAWISNFCSTGFSFVINGMYLLGIGCCGYGILHGKVSYGTMTAIIQLIGQLQTPLSGISGYVPRFYAMIASAERLMEIERYKESDTMHDKTIEEARTFYENMLQEIVFNNVSFAYDQKQGCSELVLQQLDCCIKKGDTVAIIGTSGCGKSTLLKLLMGIYEPQEGWVELRSKNGNKMSVREWKRLFAYVPQGHYLMSGSIREVITFGEEEGKITMEKALELACAEFVYHLPEGVDTLLGEKGAGLSEGQMQRIAIARALYADRPVLILDEATSALDAETEKRLLAHLKQLTDKTVLIVTHRTEALKICSRKLVFTENAENGRREVAEDARLGL